jgi:hypothetical protein
LVDFGERLARVGVAVQFGQNLLFYATMEAIVDNCYHSHFGVGFYELGICYNRIEGVLLVPFDEDMYFSAEVGSSLFVDII